MTKKKMKDEKKDERGLAYPSCVTPDLIRGPVALSRDPWREGRGKTEMAEMDCHGVQAPLAMTQKERAYLFCVIRLVLKNGNERREGADLTAAVIARPFRAEAIHRLGRNSWREGEAKPRG